MSIEKKSLISALRTTKKANVASSTPEVVKPSTSNKEFSQVKGYAKAKGYTKFRGLSKTKGIA